MPRFRAWVQQNLRSGDAVVIETTANVWDIYDIVAPLVTKTVVVRTGRVRQIAEARVKTDIEDIKLLLSFRWRLGKQITMSKNRIHSVIQRFNLQPGCFSSMRAQGDGEHQAGD